MRSGAEINGRSWESRPDGRGADPDGVDWTYPEKSVRLLFFRCTLAGEPTPLEGQEMRWVAAADLPSPTSFPEADATLIWPGGSAGG